MRRVDTGSDGRGGNTFGGTVLDTTAATDGDTGTTAVTGSSSMLSLTGCGAERGAVVKLSFGATEGSRQTNVAGEHSSVGTLTFRWIRRRRLGVSLSKRHGHEQQCRITSSGVLSSDGDPRSGATVQYLDRWRDDVDKQLQCGRKGRITVKVH